MDKHDVVVQAVEVMKKSQFGLTAIKVELEAQIGRRNHGNGCGDCDDGRRYCMECEGDYEGSRCEQCDGEGEIEVDNETVVCDDCEEGYYPNCEYCEEGYVDCEDCTEEDRQGSNRDWRSEMVCHEWIMEKLSHMGLAEQTDEHIMLAHDYNETNWHPIAPLKYAEFYNDGSVDSEFTFTLSMENPETVMLLPKFIEIFNEFAEVAGTRMSTEGAGMHMALLNSTDCSYPTGNSSRHVPRFHNFQKSMGLLMPALYFLGSSDDRSRSMSYRRPEIGSDTHRTAVDWRGGALEFRVFNTCYDNPEAILDNVVVMQNCLRYWTTKYRKTGLGKITPSGCQFGVDGSDKLERFYITLEHIDLLNRGLQLLKPSYYTVREVKTQRKFNMTKTHVKNRLKRVRVEAEIEYKEYEDRYGWSIDIRRNQLMAEMIDNHLRSTPAQVRMAENRDEVVAMIEPVVKAEIEKMAREKEPLDRYVERKVRDETSKRVGQFTLQPEGV